MHLKIKEVFWEYNSSNDPISINYHNSEWEMYTFFNMVKVKSRKKNERRLKWKVAIKLMKLMMA